MTAKSTLQILLTLPGGVRYSGQAPSKSSDDSRSVSISGAAICAARNFDSCRIAISPGVSLKEKHYLPFLFYQMRPARKGSARSDFVPTLAIFEVFKRVLQQRTEGDALQAIAVMRQGMVVDLDTPIALRAAKLSVVDRLPTAGSVILATTRTYDATLWTQDADFKDLPGVQYRARKR